MSAQHDMGGRTESFGPIVREDGEPVFHAPWEARVFGISTFVQTLFGVNLDRGRRIIERLPAEEYSGPYYLGWLVILEQTLRPYLDGYRSVARVKVAGTTGVLRYGMGRRRLPRLINSRIMPRIVGGGRRPKKPPQFHAGDRVRVAADRPSGHNRCPGYVSGRIGTVTAHLGAAVFADRNAENVLGSRTMRGSKTPEHLYTVAFDGAELWGAEAEPNTEVLVDLFEPYLEAA
jgi:nitrile hydratase beta subunit